MTNSNQDKRTADSKNNKTAEKNKKKMITIIVGIIIIALACGWIIYARQTSDSYKYLDYDKYIKLGKYKGLTYQEKEVNITQKDVDAEIESILAMEADTKEIKKGKVKDGDTINIDYTGKIDGKEFDGGSTEGFELKIGSKTFIDGFEEGLIGKNIGDTVDINVTFPEDYQDSAVAGKDAVFTVKINSKIESKVGKYDDEFVKKHSTVETKEEYEEILKKQLEQEKEDANMDEIEQELWTQVYSSSKVLKYPKRQYKAEKENVNKYYKSVAEQYGVEFKDFQEQFGITDEQIKETTKDAVKMKLCLYAIAKKEGIKVTDKEYREKIDEMLKEYGFTEKEFEKEFDQTATEYAEEQDMRSAMLLDKINEFIYDNAKVEKADKK